MMRFFSQSRVQVLMLLIFCAWLFILGVGYWNLWDPDEPRYAEVAKEMVDGGNWILPHLNGKVYGDKPPLFFWLIALSSHLWGGFSSFAVRFPPALFGTLTVLLTFFVGKRLYGSRAGFLSGLVLATSLEFAYLSIRANIDTTLTFFTTASILCFLLWFQQRKEVKTCEHPMGGLRLLGFYVAMALGTLAKGPIGFIIPLLVSLIYLAIQKDWKAIRSMRLLPGMLLFMIIVLVWYLPAVLSGGKAYLQETLFKHTVDAYAKGWTHVQPIYYYFLNFPLDFLPWTLFLPGVVAIGFSRRKDGVDKRSLFLLIWFVSIFLFFSFSKGKRPIYLLPLYPAASIAVGNFWDRYISNSDPDSKRKIWVSFPVYVLAALLLVTGIALYSIPVLASLSTAHTSPLMMALIKDAEAGANYLSKVPYSSYLAFILLLLGLGSFLLFSQWLRSKKAVFLLIPLTAGVVFFYGTRFIFPKIDPFKSARFFSQEIRQVIKPGEKLAMYGGFAIGPYNFYTGIVPILDIKGKEEMVEFFRSKEMVFCLIQNHEYEALRKKDLGISLNLVLRREVGGKDIVLISNR